MKTLKRIILMGLCWLTATLNMAAMSTSEVREYARFMTDRMGYELQLSAMQRDDVYEINYDFFAGMRHLIDDLSRGESYAVDRYYESLDLRNEDLSYVLTRSQYERFFAREYFYRPLRTTGSRCEIRLYSVYSNPTHFYFSAPSIFLTYNGLHSRLHFSTGFYCRRYHHPRYAGPMIRPSRHTHYADYRWHDFGVRPSHRPARPRPSVSHRPGVGNSHRPMRSGHDVRPSRPQGRPDYRPNIRPETRPNRPNVRPDQRPNVRPNRPQNKPEVRPDQRPGQRPQTRPEARPQTKPAQRPSSSRPVSRPNVRPAQRSGHRQQTRQQTRPRNNKSDRDAGQRPSRLRAA